jgi:hypothetical protein
LEAVIQEPEAKEEAQEFIVKPNQKNQHKKQGSSQRLSLFALTQKT